MLKLCEYIMHSGGAYGADISWEEIGRTFGLKNFNHYYSSRRTPFGNVEISKSDFNEGVHMTHKANLTLRRHNINKYLYLFARNWVQVKNSDVILAVSNLKSRTIVDGGTGWAVQMAIDSKKPVFVFNQEYELYKGMWCRWDYRINEFVPMYDDVPVLERNFAGIGSRNITEKGLTAITNVYYKTFT